MTNIIQKAGRIITGTFSLADVPGFPNELYESQKAIYRKYENWMRGQPLEETIQKKGKKIEKYPLKINPLISTVQKHAYILFGETSDDGRPLVITKVIPNQDDDTHRKRAEEAESALNHLWWENNGRALMMENGIISQIYGGCIFKATYVPWEGKDKGGWRTIPIRIERVHPKSFVGRVSSGDMYRLDEAWIVSDMPLEEARKWGYDGYDDTPTYIQYWDKDKYWTQINEQEASFPMANPDEYKNPLKGTNVFNFVPVVYIPHIRVGGFHGLSVIEPLKGLIKELNMRFADYGDAVSVDSHNIIAISDVNGTPQLVRIADGLEVVNLGSAGNITGNEISPKMFEVMKAKASPAMQNLLKELTDQYRRDSFVPAVAYGEDEGSQRSALTLATRFWPLIAHVGMERINFSTGLDVFNTYLLRMMAKLGIRDLTEEHTEMRMKQSWAPMLPRDREAEVQEWASRAQNNIGSIEHLLELPRDIDDIAQEREKILKWIEDVEEIKAKVQSKYNVSVSSPSSTNPAIPQKGRPKQKPEIKPSEKHGGGGGGEA